MDRSEEMPATDDSVPPRSRGAAKGQRAGELPDGLVAVLNSAARLQEVVPDAVLVGGTASVIDARHRLSLDHDHVLQLERRYLEVLAAVEATDGWATSVRASRPPMTIMGELDGIEAGLRQLRRVVPLETERFELGDGRFVNVPTRAEMLRIKAFLVVQRNMTRDYIDTAALADSMGMSQAAQVIGDIDEFYRDLSNIPESVVSAVIEKLAKPEPKDASVTRQLERYKGLVERWQHWAETQRVCRELAQSIVQGSE